MFSHQTAPQSDTVQSILPVLISNTRNSSFAYAQGFLIGGNVTVSYRDSYLNENAPTDVLNPSSAPSLTLTVQQNLLRGFGIAVNARTIRVSQLNVKASALNFKTQVSNTVNQVLNLYYGLSASYEDIKAKSNAVEVAQKFYENSGIQERAGTLARLDVITAESQLASAQYDLVNSQTNLRQQELLLKNLLSRRGLADPVLASVQIVPLDRIAVPDSDEPRPLKDLLQTALANRSDLAAERMGITSSEISSLGTKNGLLPLLVGIGTESTAGLAGTAGNVGYQFWHRKRPTLTSTAESAPRSAKFCGETSRPTALRDISKPRCTMIRPRPTTRSTSCSSANRRCNSARISIRWPWMFPIIWSPCGRPAGVIAPRSKPGFLQQQLLDAEQKKLAGGASTPFNVVQQQRDLVAAQSAEIAALVDFSNARVALDQTLGITLEVNHVAIEDAQGGKVQRVSSVAEPAK